MDYLKRKDEVRAMFNRCRVDASVIIDEAGLNYQVGLKALNGKTDNPKSDHIDALYHVLVKRMHING